MVNRSVAVYKTVLLCALLVAGACISTGYTQTLREVNENVLKGNAASAAAQEDAKAAKVSASEAQEDAEEAKEQTQEVKQILHSVMDTLRSLVKAEQLNEEEIVGRLYLRTPNSYIWMKNGDNAIKTGVKIRIKRVRVVIKDGWITSSDVFTEDGRHFTNQIPIACSDKRINHRLDRLFQPAFKDENDFIILQHILGYELEASEGYLPDDIIVDMTPQDTIVLKKAVGLNSIFDIRVYSDALGLFGGEPNGLLQTDARYKLIINRTNIPNTRGFWLPYVRTQLTASKLDSRYKYEPLDEATFSRLNLVQKSWLNFELALSPFACFTHSKSFSLFYTEVGANVHATQVAKATDTFSVNIPNFFVETGFNYKVSRNIGLDIFTRTTVQYSPQTDFSDSLQRDADAIWYQRLGAEMYWNPNENKAGRLFARGVYFFAYNPEERKRSFLQVQLGYAVLLSKLAGFK